VKSTGRKKKKEIIARKPGRTGLLVTVIAGLCIAIFLFWVTRKEITRWEVPGYLVGRWISSAPGYQERYLEISDVSLIFATSPTTVSEYFITNISTTATAKETSLAIESKDAQDITYHFALTYQPVQGGLLFFKNQPHIIWKKESS
jgi:hypothetical protein